MKRVYMCIDLKSFYASVECVERSLDPLKTNLVVADISRTDKTVCLAVTPSLKQYGIGGRARLYQVKEEVKKINQDRKRHIRKNFTGKSYNDDELKNDDNLELDFIIATPRMKLYMKYSTMIYQIYLKYLSSEDIYVYSIDEVFMDVTNYLNLYHMNPIELATTIIHDVYEKTGITATAGIGTNMYLAKVAMDIVAKHVKANINGVRIAALNETRYRKLLWNHKPLTDFWRIGRGISTKLEKNGMYTMGDICIKSLEDEDLLYKLFGVNAELIIDHAWGYEPCTIKDIKSYKPISNSLSQGQVLHEPYNFEKAMLIVKEMTELLTLDLVSKHYVTNNLTLTIGYDIENLTNENIRKNYYGEIKKDHYGREIPKNAHGTIRIDEMTSSTKIITSEIERLYKRIVDPDLLIRRINISANNLIKEERIKPTIKYKQFDLFTDISKEIEKEKIKKQDEEKEKKIQETILNIKYKYGKNSILKGMNLMEGARTIERNKEVGGHKG